MRRRSAAVSGLRLHVQCTLRGKEAESGSFAFNRWHGDGRSELLGRCYLCGCTDCGLAIRHADPQLDVAGSAEEPASNFDLHHHASERFAVVKSARNPMIALWDVADVMAGMVERHHSFIVRIFRLRRQFKENAGFEMTRTVARLNQPVDPTRIAAHDISTAAPNPGHPSRTGKGNRDRRPAMDLGQKKPRPPPLVPGLSD